MLKEEYEFIATFHYTEDNITTSFQDLPGCFSCAITEEEAIENTRVALVFHLWEMEKVNEEIPEPTQLEDIKLKSGDKAIFIDVLMPLELFREYDEVLKEEQELLKELIEVDAKIESLEYKQTLLLEEEKEITNNILALDMGII